jgi:tRNA pseudouridine38-40 synthase
MQQAAPHLVGEHDFTSFAASDPDLSTRTGAADGEGEAQKDAVRTIFDSRWERRDDLYVYRVTGSGFLHHMVRNLVGTFVDIGARRIPVDALPNILAARNRAAAGPTAPASGLFLVSVEYPPHAPERDS